MQSAIEPADAAKELLRRRRARASLIDYSQAIEIPGAPLSEDPDEWLFKPIETQVAAHHRLMMAAIERCIRADYGRLMLFVPPGSAKSTYASVVAPTWAMGAFPGLRVLMTSYAEAPIIRASRRARQIVRSPSYSAIWPERPMLLKGSEAANEWELSNGSGILAAGIMGGITSSRADLAIIDDPVAGREEADSEQMRAKTRAAYDDDVLTRLKPKGSVILILTRWHEADLAGSILPEGYDGRSGPVACRDGKTWEVLNLPAEAERLDDPLGRKPGEMLWPEWFGPEHWAIFRQNPRTWSALYQQRPVPATGGLFERDNFRRYQPGQQPARLRMYGGSDWAVTKKLVSNDPDFTEHYVAGQDEDGNLWFVDGYFDQESPDETIKAKIGLHRTHKPVLWFDRAGKIKNATEPLASKIMQEEGTYCATIYLPDNEDKVVKSTSLRGRVAAGKVYIPIGPVWASRLIDQLCAFPMGPRDDGVDASSNIAAGLEYMANADKEKPRDRPRVPEPFTAEWLAWDGKDPVDERAKRGYYG